MLIKPGHWFEKFLGASPVCDLPPRWYHYLIQVLLVLLFTFAVLYFFRNAIMSDMLRITSIASQETALWALGVSSLSSSAYIVFTQPHEHAANGLVLLAAYLIAFCVGAVVHWILSYFLHVGTMLHPHHFLQFAGMAAIGVSLTLSLMLLFRLTHPPAAGITIVLIVDMQHYYTITVIAIAAIALAIAHLLLRHFLRQLR